MTAVIQHQRVVAVGQDERLALMAALLMPEGYFDPDEDCLLVPAEHVDPALTGKTEKH